MESSTLLQKKVCALLGEKFSLGADGLQFGSASETSSMLVAMKAAGENLQGDQNMPKQSPICKSIKSQAV